MYKKMMLIIAIFLITFSIYGDGNEDQIKAYWDNMKKQGYLTPENEDYNLIKNHFVEIGRIKSINAPDINQMELPDAVRNYNWKRYYCKTVGKTEYKAYFIMPPTVIVYNNSVYQMPVDFNYLIKDNGIKIDSTNVFGIIKKFIKLNVLVDTEVEKIEYKKAKSMFDSTFKRDNYTYNIEATSISKYDVKIKWNFAFTNGKIKNIRYFILHASEEVRKKFSLGGMLKDDEGHRGNEGLLNFNMFENRNPQTTIYNSDNEDIGFELYYLHSEVLQEKSYLTRKVNNIVCSSDEIIFFHI